MALIILPLSSCDEENYDNFISPSDKQEYTQLPKVIITTPRHSIIDKRAYVEDSYLLITDGTGKVQFEGEMKIKGRGNTNWYQVPKKSYAIKFPEKQSLLGFPKAKSWVLLGNYDDKTFLKTDLAFYMGRTMCKFDYTPHLDFVALTLNDDYCGIYQLGDKLTITKGRVNNGHDGFLLEIDGKSDEGEDITFNTPHISFSINIKDPEVTIDSEDYHFIKDYVIASEAALYSDNFTDEEEGYRKYIDADSFVEWYLINEIAKNNDAAFYSSCYMHIERGGKLKMGPLWDFDWSFGGTYIHNNDKPEGFWIRDNASWYTRLFQDPAFTAQVKSRFREIYAERQKIYDRIDLKADFISHWITEDNRKWGNIIESPTSKPPSQQAVVEAYMENVDDLRIWIEARLKWMNENLDNL